MKELGLAADRIEEICYGIAIHVDDEADFPGERTPFALSVGDADNIDRFDAYRIHETLSHGKFLELTFNAKQDYVTKRISRLGELMELPMGTQAAAALWRERVGFYFTFFEKLSAQLSASVEIAE